LRPFVHVDDLESTAAYALRIAGSPSAARAWVTTNARDLSVDVRERRLVETLLAKPVIIRAARYVVISTMAILETRGISPRPLPWSV
jgi:hypothetical protein